MELRVGTSGFSYKEWKGSFYPEDLPAKQMLRFYAERLPAVEINNTFYRLPKPALLEGWAEQVPESFRFVLKASRRITHFKRLKDVADETGYLVRTAGALGPRLGALLFQLPPNLPCDAGRLEAFLALLPEGTRAAFEPRHPSWRDERVHALLRARGCALACVDDGESEALPEIVPTARWGYLRLRGAGYPRSELASWAAKIAEHGWDDAFVFFKHEDAGAGPALAEEFLTLAARGPAPRPALPVRRPRRREAG